MNVQKRTPTKEALRKTSTTLPQAQQSLNPSAFHAKGIGNYTKLVERTATFNLESLKSINIQQKMLNS